MQDESVQLNNESVLKKLNDFKVLFDEIDNKIPELIPKEKANAIKSCFKWHEDLNASKFPIAFAGVFSAGKSSIINSILKKNLLPTHEKKTTAFPTIISKSTNDKAVLHFFNKEEMNSVINSFIHGDIKNLLKNESVKDDLNVFFSINKKNSEEVYEKIKLCFRKDFSIYKNNSLDDKYSPYDDKTLEKMNEILEGYIDDCVNYIKRENEEVTLEKIKEIKEGNDKARFIKKAEIFISDNNLPNNFVLVDLPGIGVTNKQHEKFSRDYLANQAKAVVLCLKSEPPEKEQTELILSVDTNIRDRLFWLVNKWDTVKTEEMKGQIKDSMNAFIKDNSKQLSDSVHSKPFYISALTYSFLLEVANKNVSPDNVEDIVKVLRDGVDEQFSPPSLETKKSEYLRNEDIVKLSKDYLAGNGKSCLLIDNFNSFEKELFNFIEYGLKKKLLGSANKDIKLAMMTLSDILDKEQKNLGKYSNDDVILDSHARDKQYRVYKDIDNRIEVFKEKNYKNKYQVWSKNNDKEITDTLSQILSNKNEIKNEMMKRQGQGANAESFIETINAINAKIDLVEMLREKMINSVNDNVIKDMRSLKNDILYKHGEIIGQSVKDRLKGEQDEKDVHMRIYGLSDPISFKIKRDIEKLALESKKDKSNNDFIDLYQNILKNYYDKEISQEVSDSLNESMQNHTVFFSKELIKLIKRVDHVKEMFALIKSQVKDSPYVKNQKEQKDLINSTITKLEGLKKGIMYM